MIVVRFFFICLGCGWIVIEGGKKSFICMEGERSAGNGKVGHLNFKKAERQTKSRHFFHALHQWRDMCTGGLNVATAQPPPTAWSSGGVVKHDQIHDWAEGDDEEGETESDVESESIAATLSRDPTEGVPEVGEEATSRLVQEVTNNSSFPEQIGYKLRTFYNDGFDCDDGTDDAGSTTMWSCMACYTIYDGNAQCCHEMNHVLVSR